MSFEVDRTFILNDFLEVSKDIWGDEVYGRNAFSIVKYYKDDMHEQPSIVPLSLQDRMMSLARQRGLEQHPFHGAIGKSFDVISVLSGLREKVSIGASHRDEPFISYVVLWDDLDRSPFDDDQSQRMRNNLKDIAAWQIRTGLRSGRDYF